MDSFEVIAFLVAFALFIFIAFLVVMAIAKQESSSIRAILVGSRKRLLITSTTILIVAIIMLLCIAFIPYYNPMSANDFTQLTDCEAADVMLYQHSNDKSMIKVQISLSGLLVGVEHININSGLSSLINYEGPGITWGSKITTKEIHNKEGFTIEVDEPNQQSHVYDFEIDLPDEFGEEIPLTIEVIYWSAEWTAPPIYFENIHVDCHEEFRIQIN